MKRGKTNLKLSRYLDDVAQHVACLFLLEHDNDSKPICNQACTHNCQHCLRNQIDILKTTNGRRPAIFTISYFSKLPNIVKSLGEEITNEFPATKHRPADD